MQNTNHYRILIVDDIVENIQVAMSTLKDDGYEFSFAKSGMQALEVIQKNDFDLILLDIMMPGLDGFYVCRELKNNVNTRDIPIIFLTAKADIESIEKAFEVGGIDYITKPFQASELKARVRTHLELFRAKRILTQNNLTLQEREKDLQKKNEEILQELVDNQLDIIYILTELLESVSDETGLHSKRVAYYSRLLAHYHKDLSKKDEDLVFYAAPLHDVGKIAIPHEILYKAGPLTDDEFALVKTHTTKANEYLSKAKRSVMKAANIISYGHHEKWDGSGYPLGLKGEEIHIYARIVAIADVFDALTHKRVYKEAWSTDDAVSAILEGRGTHFDPLLVDIFNEHRHEFIELSKMQ